MKNYIITVFICFFATIGCLAQANYNDEVLLKNKGKLVGKILEYDANSHVLIKFIEGDEFRIPMDKIKRVKMYQAAKSIPFEFKKGWQFRTMLSLLTGESAQGYSLSQNATYHFSRWLGIGGGVGIDNYYSESGRNIIPIFLEGRSYLNDHLVSPYVALRTGYGFARSDIDEGQVVADPTWMINPQIGFRISGTDTTLEIFAGLKFQKADYVFHASERTRTEDILFKRLELGISVAY